jgi:hypothetical protein
MVPARQSQPEICHSELKLGVALSGKVPTDTLPLRSYGTLE